MCVCTLVLASCGGCKRTEHRASKIVPSVKDMSNHEEILPYIDGLWWEKHSPIKNLPQQMLSVPCKYENVKSGYQYGT